MSAFHIFFLVSCVSADQKHFLGFLGGETVLSQHTAVYPVFVPNIFFRMSSLSASQGHRPPAPTTEGDESSHSSGQPPHRRSAAPSPSPHPRFPSRHIEVIELSPSPPPRNEVVEQRDPQPEPHKVFKSITVHTAKCDVCNNHNKSILHRCIDCGWQICTPCWLARGGNGAHGATRTFTGPVFQSSSSDEEDDSYDPDEVMAEDGDVVDDAGEEIEDTSNKGKEKARRDCGVVGDNEKAFHPRRQPKEAPKATPANPRPYSDFTNDWYDDDAQDGDDECEDDGDDSGDCNNKGEMELDDSEVEMERMIIGNKKRPRELSPESERRINCLLRAAQEALQDLDSDATAPEQRPAKTKRGCVRGNRSPLFVPLETSGGKSTARPDLPDRYRIPESQIPERREEKFQSPGPSTLKRETKATLIPPSPKDANVACPRANRRARLWNPQEPPERMDISDHSSEDDEREFKNPADQPASKLH